MKLTKRRILILYTTLLIAGMLSCSENRDGAHTFSVTNEQGVVLASNSATPRYAEELFSYDLYAELTEDEREESYLSRPGVAFLDDRGYFFVPDRARSSSRIAVYNPQGRYVYDIGRHGDGPGEFRSPAIMSISEGLLLVFDTQQRRLTSFQTDGRVLEVSTLPPEVYSTRWRCWHRDQSRHSILIESVVPRSSGSAQRETRMVSASIYSASWDSITTVATDPFKGAKSISAREGRAEMTGAGLVPFLAYPSVVYSPRIGIVSSRGLEPEIYIHGLDGVLQKKIRIEFTLIPITSADREAYMHYYTELTKNNTGIALAFTQQQLAEAEYPEHKSFWGDPGAYPGWLQVDDWGYIWIRIPTYLHPPDLPLEASRFHVISPAGEYLGHTTLPEHRRGRCRIDRGKLITMQTDPETGAEKIRAYYIYSAIKGFTYPEPL